MNCLWTVFGALLLLPVTVFLCVRLGTYAFFLSRRPFLKEHQEHGE